MKKLLLCFAFLSLSNRNLGAGLLDCMKAATSCANVFSASSDDIVAETMRLPFSTGSVGLTLVAGVKGIGAVAMFDKDMYMIGVPMRTLVAAFLVTGGLYLAYKVGCWKQGKKSEKE